MSRVGNQPISIPGNISVLVEEKKILIKGKFGSLTRTFPKELNVSIASNEIIVSRINETRHVRALHGLYRVLIYNMIQGTAQGFKKNLIAEGVGYKFQVEKQKLTLNVGFSHPIHFLAPVDITIQTDSPTKLMISGADKEKVGAFASQIRKVRPPEPYKGKGILYEGEKILRKAGKTGRK